MMLEQFNHPLNRDCIWILTEGAKLKEELIAYERTALQTFNHSGSAFGDHTKDTAYFNWEIGRSGRLGPFTPTPYQSPIKYESENLCFSCFIRLASFLGSIYFVQDHVSSKFKKDGLPRNPSEVDLDKYAETKSVLDSTMFQNARSLRNKLHTETSILYCEVIGPITKPLEQVNAIRVKDTKMNEIIETDVKELCGSICKTVWDLQDRLFSQ